MYKMVIVVPQDLKMTHGKAMSQVAHAASEHSLILSATQPDLWKEYEKSPVMLVCSVKTTGELLQVLANAAKAKLPFYSFVDRPPTTQNTEFKITAVAIGPAKNARIDKITGKLKLY